MLIVVLVLLAGLSALAENENLGCGCGGLIALCALAQLLGGC